MTARELARELVSLVSDVPLFITAPLLRHWHLRWGATQVEVTAAMPGDSLLPRAGFRGTRAITIHASQERVWPWLVQVGCLRGGFYSHDLLDNLGHASARVIVPELQHLQIGDWVPMSPSEPNDVNAFRVEAFETERWLLWRKFDSTWAWKLIDAGDGSTRLVTRVHATHDWGSPLSAVLAVALMEFGDFAMMRRMLRGIKDRAEREPAWRGGRAVAHARNTA